MKAPSLLGRAQAPSFRGALRTPQPCSCLPSGPLPPATWAGLPPPWALKEVAEGMGLAHSILFPLPHTHASSRARTLLCSPACSPRAASLL